MLAQLVYISSRHKSCSTKQIAKILEASRPYNEKHQITGILLYSESSFLQVLEGDRLDILLLYDKIKKDSRHQKIAMISYTFIQERCFPAWAMASKMITKSDYQFLNQLKIADRLKFRQLLHDKRDSNLTRIINKLFKQ